MGPITGLLPQDPDHRSRPGVGGRTLAVTGHLPESICPVSPWRSVPSSTPTATYISICFGDGVSPDERSVTARERAPGFPARLAAVGPEPGATSSIRAPPGFAHGRDSAPTRRDDDRVGVRGHGLRSVVGFSSGTRRSSFARRWPLRPARQPLVLEFVDTAVRVAPRRPHRSGPTVEDLDVLGRRRDEGEIPHRHLGSCLGRPEPRPVAGTCWRAAGARRGPRCQTSPGRAPAPARSGRRRRRSWGSGHPRAVPHRCRPEAGASVRARPGARARIPGISPYRPWHASDAVERRSQGSTDPGRTTPQPGQAAISRTVSPPIANRELATGARTGFGDRRSPGEAFEDLAADDHRYRIASYARKH